ncbi:MAG: hypothetical protein CMJ48_03650 [Planctomycetaceae bacterium]|nr:hypothetical protein [Planctomycetaceae bacterium]
MDHTTRTSDTSAPAAGNETNGANDNGTLSVPAPLVLPLSVVNAADGEEATVNFHVLWGAFRRRWLLASVLGLIFGVAAAAAAWELLPAPFTATAQVRINSFDPFFFFKVDNQTPRFETYKQTQMILVRSPLVLMAALRSPELAGLSEWTDPGQNTQEWLEENLEVSSRASEFISISLSGERPTELKDTVNAVMGAYLQEEVAGAAAARRERLTKLENLFAKRRAELETKRRRTETLSEQTGAITEGQRDWKYQNDLAIQRSLIAEFRQVKVQLINLRFDQTHLENDKASGQPAEVPDDVLEAALSRDPQYAAASKKVAELERRVQQNDVELSETHPTLVKFKKQLADAQKHQQELQEELKPQIAQQILGGMAASGEMSNLERKKLIGDLLAWQAELEKKIDEHKTTLTKNNIFNAELNRLDQDIAQDGALIDAIATQIEQIEVEIENSPKRIMEFRKADAPQRRDQKKKITGAAAAGFGVFGLFVAAIVFLEYRSHRISRLEEVVDGLGMRIVGNIPTMPRASSRRPTGDNRGKTAFWNSVLSESIDSARTVLLRDAKVDSLKAVMICSAVGGEGKSTLSCHLATSLARAGRKVLLIDCDLRRPSICRVFDLPQIPGVCELLRGESSLDDCTREVAPEGLSVIPAGKIDHTVLRLLAEDAVGELFENVKKQYDFVIIDSAPVLFVTDSLLIAQHVDGVLFAVRRDISRAMKVASAQQRLSMLGVPMLGAVVIGLDRDSYGYNSRYGRNYQSYQQYRQYPR